MAETKRYDVSGMAQGDGRPFPNGTILKLTDDQAKKMGLGSGNVSKMTTTADDPKKRAAFEQQQTEPASTKKRGAKDKAAE